MSTTESNTQESKSTSSKRKYAQAGLIISLMALGIAIPLMKAYALTDVGNAGIFELDGNIVKNSSGAFPTDWGALFSSTGVTQPLPTGGLDASWVNDGPHQVVDPTTFTTGSKDVLDIA